MAKLLLLALEGGSTASQCETCHLVHDPTMTCVAALIREAESMRAALVHIQLDVEEGVQHGLDHDAMRRVFRTIKGRAALALGGVIS